MLVTAYIGIGSNEGDKKANCLTAVELLTKAGRISAVSSLYTTEPVGYEEQEDFINAVAALETELPPEELLDLCQSIEKRLGRKRTVRWGPRTIDLDILLYGNLVMNAPRLVIPHLLMSARKFVLAPLVEIAPDAMHPMFKKTAQQLLLDLRGQYTVVKCKPENRAT